MRRNKCSPMTDRSARPTKTRAFTLLELMLSLTLTGIVLMAIGMAIDLNLKLLTVKRTRIEDAQLARSTLRLIANDLRSVIQHNEQDFSGIESLLQGSLKSAAASVASAGGETGSPQGGATPGGQQGGNQPSSGAVGGSGNSSQGGTSGGSGGGASGGGGSSGGGSGGGTSSTAGSGSSGSSAQAAADTSSTEDIASNLNPPPVPGLYGNQYELLIDISRLPRVDEYQASIDPDNPEGAIQIPSDVKTVAYYLGQGRDSSSVSSTAGSMSSSLRNQKFVTGLVRRELDRSVTQYASENGNLQELESKAEVIVPEVMGLEFRYFDGVEWLTEWDSAANEGLPLAVEVLIGFQPPVNTANPNARPSSSSDPLSSAILFRQVVCLPAAKLNSGSKDQQSKTNTSSSGQSGQGSGT